MPKDLAADGLERLAAVLAAPLPPSRVGCLTGVIWLDNLRLSTIN